MRWVGGEREGEGGSTGDVVKSVEGIGRSGGGEMRRARVAAAGRPGFDRVPSAIAGDIGSSGGGALNTADRGTPDESFAVLFVLFFLVFVPLSSPTLDEPVPLATTGVGEDGRLSSPVFRFPRDSSARFSLISIR